MDQQTKQTVLACRERGVVADVAADAEPNAAACRQREEAVIAEALAILGRRTARARYTRVNGPADVKRYLVLQYAQAERETFGVLWLDFKHRILACEALSLGTLTQCSVYPREVVKAGLRHNAARCILFHNHPSGLPEPSEADRVLTRTLVQALALVDMNVLDHIIVGGTATYSFAEHGDL
jgi:DNA repair protein RadC